MRSKSASQIADLLREKISEIHLEQYGTLGKSTFIKLLDLLECRCRGPVKKHVRKNRPHPKTREEIDRLLRHGNGNGNGKDKENDNDSESEQEKDEEDIHPWGSSAASKGLGKSASDRRPTPQVQGLYLRAWDDRSQCKIRDDKEGFTSGSHYEKLDTKALRKAAIEHHANWGNRKKTPFISATSDIAEIQDHRVPHFEKRQRDSGDKPVTRVTLINGNATLADGLPLLRMRTEIDYHEADTRYKSSFFANEYLFLFRIPPNQIVRTWLWKDIEKWMNEHDTESIQSWFKQIAVPAFEAHELARKTGSSASMHGPKCTCCGHRVILVQRHHGTMGCVRTHLI
jgi:hypothetical protein